MSGPARPAREDEAGREDPAAGPGPEDRARPAPRAGRRRRVDAAPTNPAADGSDDVVTPRTVEPRPAERSVDPRDTWIADQRPPHWD